MKTRWITSLLSCLLAGCAQLHHVQISDIDNTDPHARKFDVKASDLGVNVNDAAAIAGAVSNSGTVQKAAGSVSLAWALLTYGPRTGNVTFSSDYADQLVSRLSTACPSGKIGMLTSVRESNRYPVVSGEIVRLVGYCNGT